ncbi:peptide ABC transporter permease [Brevibacillus reuszeri]|uniref:Nickel import system permease protein NikB n=1 Tax=Brevibacillus reuszeri TaxID=54915 RepID=A0A0K9YL45_9BACL|nr:nickel ABC transporter permease [Brevibacillus reuszeri]KNB69376.1 peptide ABC transporter permease [Brevibacillus reuszeri]MED1860316.1 ABC transporter permease [Brevibacillus reuszeri]GED70796.1 peptide ABC transporter permease [Brevibacillus reuszeri]
MAQYLWNRLAAGLLVVFGISVFTFALVHMIPGDPVRMMLGQKATQEQVEHIREQMGLNKPLVEQYTTYVTGIIQGDFGTSLKTGQPVLTEIMNRFPATLKIAVTAILIAIVVGIAMGIVAAKYKDTIVDRAVLTLATMGVSIPGYWLGLLLMLLFAVKWKWFPIAGGTGLKDLVLPAVTLGVYASTIICRLTRSGMLEVLSQDYIRTARAKGINESVILFRHAFRNVMIPVVTVVGLQMASLLGGAVLIEQVFSWPGIGTLAIDAIFSRDFPMIQGTTLFMGIVYVSVNIVIDLLYGFIDPRIDVSQQKAGA